jgi:hypothetical protein
MNSMHSASHILLKVPKEHTSLGRSSFQFTAASDWNKLQQTLKLDVCTMFCAAAMLWCYHVVVMLCCYHAVFSCVAAMLCCLMSLFM